MYNEQYLIDKIKDSIEVSTGCTEPVAIALNCATARKEVKGNIKKLTITLDTGMLKNATAVGIPGSTSRGIKMCAAIGFCMKNPPLTMDILSAVNDQADADAKKIVDKVEICERDDIETLFIETVVETDEDCVRVITFNEHNNIVTVDRPPFKKFEAPKVVKDLEIQKYSMEDMKKFADTVSIDKIAFVQEGIDMNRKVAEAGMKVGLGKNMEKLVNGPVGDSVMTYVQQQVAAASYARMSGVPVPVMIATGSGNQGIACILTTAAFAEKTGASEEATLRATALALLVNVYTKSYLSTLSPLCAAGIASGLGASVGIVYLLGGNADQMFGAIRNVLGGITGMVCDGAKEGCAHKVALAATNAVLSAYLAMNGSILSEFDGILDKDLVSTMTNLGLFAKDGVAPANATILKIMMGKKM